MNKNDNEKCRTEEEKEAIGSTEVEFSQRKTLALSFIDTTAVLLIFVIGRLGFLIFKKGYDINWLYYESISILIFLFISFIARFALPSLCHGILISLAFIITAFGTRYYYLGVFQNSTIWLNIIDFIWTSLLGITLGGILFCYNYPIFHKGCLEENARVEYYTQLSAELNLLLTQTVNILIVLGSIVAICMTIIWSGQPWRNLSAENVGQYVDTTQSAIAMAFSYFVILTAVALWIVVPLYKNYSALKNKLLNCNPV